MSSEQNKIGQQESASRFFFDEPRLKMTIPGRLLVRISSYITYLVLLAAAFTFVFSDIISLKALGIFLLLFLGDRALHLKEADRPFGELPKTGRVNLAEYLSPAAYAILERAFDKARLTRKKFFLEIIRELLSLPEIIDGLRRLDIKPEEFRQKTEELLESSQDTSLVSDKAKLFQNVEALVLQAAERSLTNNHRFIERVDLFSGLFSVADENVNRLFNVFSVEPADLELALLLSSLKKSWRFRLPRALGGFTFEVQRKVRHRIMNRAWTSRPTPTLDKFSTDLTDLARAGKVGFLIGHEKEYQRLVDTLARPLNPNVLLVGEEGIGKETIISHLAARIIKDEVPAAIFDKRLVSLEINNLVAGAAPEELQERLKRIVDDIFMADNIILCIPDIHNLVKTSGAYYLSAADALMPVIKNNTFPVIGITYPKEFKEFIENRSDFTSLFEIIRVEEISEAEAQKVLIYESLLLERKTGVRISFAAIKKAVFLAKKYFSGKPLPSSAEELLKDALVAAERKQEAELKPDEVVVAAEEKINVPIHETGASEAEKLLRLEEIIHQRLIDQEESVQAVSAALREYRSGLTRPGGPIASFLFVGPTGVGKTELAKILAKIQFGENAMVRFDMTEYQSKESFYRFIGSPDGRISGALTEAALQKPYCLILLDEFEKAFPDILNLFLQVFDDGRLTDNLGRTVDFQNTIIIATSNAHSDIINEALAKGEKMTDITEYLKRKLVDVFKPELLNRFSKVVVFKDLSPEDVGKIAVLNLNDLAGILSEQGIKLEFDESAVKQIAKLGYEPAFGARPLRRAIEENLRALLAEEILSKKVSRGSKVKAVFQEGKFQFVNVKE